KDGIIGKRFPASGHHIIEHFKSVVRRYLLDKVLDADLTGISDGIGGLVVTVSISSDGKSTDRSIGRGPYFGRDERGIDTAGEKRAHWHVADELAAHSVSYGCIHGLVRFLAAEIRLAVQRKFEKPPVAHAAFARNLHPTAGFEHMSILKQRVRSRNVTQA